MPALVLSLAALLICGCTVDAAAGNEHRRSGAELLQAAEQSFSSIPFGTTLPPPDLNLVDDGGCVDGRGECTYLDANHVLHYFDADGGELVVKSVMPADTNNQPIAALGIGTARALDEVVERVQLFMPEAEVTCDEQLGGIETVCGATLGDGWIRLFFDSARQLMEARIDAYHFT